MTQCIHSYFSGRRRRRRSSALDHVINISDSESFIPSRTHSTYDSAVDESLSTSLHLFRWTIGTLMTSSGLANIIWTVLVSLDWFPVYCCVLPLHLSRLQVNAEMSWYYILLCVKGDVRVMSYEVQSQNGVYQACVTVCFESILGQSWVHHWLPEGAWVHVVMATSRSARN